MIGEGCAIVRRVIAMRTLFVLFDLHPRERPRLLLPGCRSADADVIGGVGSYSSSGGCVVLLEVNIQVGPDDEGHISHFLIDPYLD